MPSARFHRHFECKCQAIGVVGDRHGGIDQHRVGAKFHGFSRVARLAQSASTTTVTVACSRMMRIWSARLEPRFEPMGTPAA